MLFDCTNPILTLVNVERLHWKGGCFDVMPRHVCALAFRLKGSASFFCGGASCDVDAGDVLYLPQRMGYQVRYTDTEMLVFHFITERNDPAPEIYRLQDPGRVCSLFLQAAEVWNQREVGHVCRCMGLFFEILSLLCREASGGALSPPFRRALTLLNGNFTDPALQISALCREAGISESGFRKLFHTHLGKSPIQYLTQLRLEHARALIASGERVETAALNSGFSDPKYFARVVRQHYHCTPKTFRLYGK